MSCCQVGSIINSNMRGTSETSCENNRQPLLRYSGCIKRRQSVELQPRVGRCGSAQSELTNQWPVRARSGSGRYECQVAVACLREVYEMACFRNIAHYGRVAVCPFGSLPATLLFAMLMECSNESCAGEPATLRHQAGIITQVAFSPNGKMLASASFDNTVVIWTLDGLKKLVVLKQSKAVFGVAFSPDSTLVVTASTTTVTQPGPVSSVGEGPAAVATVWDALTGKELADFTTAEHLTNPATCVAFSPDGKTIAVGSYGPSERRNEGQVNVWDVKTKRRTQAFTSKSGPVFSLVFSPVTVHAPSLPDSVQFSMTAA
jgi:hypothetical protein